MRAWLLLTCAIFSEVGASLALKAALDNPGFYGLVVIGYSGAFFLLSQVLREGLPLGIAYGIWGALGVALTAIASFVVFGEPLTLVMTLGLVLIVGGVLTVELGARAGRPHHKRVNP